MQAEQVEQSWAKRALIDLFGYIPPPRRRKKGNKVQGEANENKQLRQIFQDQDMLAGKSWWSLYTHNYVEPLIKAAHEHQDEKIQLEQLGEMSDNFDFMRCVPLLEAEFNKNCKKNPESNKALLWAIASVFRRKVIIDFSKRILTKVIHMIMPILTLRFTQFVEKPDEEIEQGEY